VRQSNAEALIKPTGHISLQEYVLFLRAAGGKIAFLREYLNRQPAADGKPLRRVQKLSIITPLPQGLASPGAFHLTPG